MKKIMKMKMLDILTYDESQILINKEEDKLSVHFKKYDRGTIYISKKTE